MISKTALAALKADESNRLIQFISGGKHFPIKNVIMQAKPVLVGTEVYFVICIGRLE